MQAENEQTTELEPTLPSPEKSERDAVWTLDLEWGDAREPDEYESTRGFADARELTETKETDDAEAD